MKTILLFTLTLFSLNLAYSQSVNYSDLLTAEKRPKGKMQTYISNSGDAYSLGDTLTIGKPSGSNGKFIYVSLQNTVAGIVEMNGDYVNHKIMIKDIRVLGSKGAMRVKMSAKGGNKMNVYYFYFEEAMANNEILGKGMSSSEALEKLKLAKSKLELELITKEEYDKIKDELSKYIK